MAKTNYMNTLAHIALEGMAFMFNNRADLQEKMKCTDGFINFTVGLKTESGTVEQAISFRDGKVSVLKSIPEDSDAVMMAKSDDIIMEIAKITPNEMLNLILKNKLILYGNMAYLQLFNYYISLILGKHHQKMLDKKSAEEAQSKIDEFDPKNPALSEELKARRDSRLKADAHEDKGVKYLADPYLSEYSLDSFPRIKKMHEEHFNTRPKISSERPKLMTDWFRKNGFEAKKDGTPWQPVLRQAGAFSYLMSNKEAVIRPGSLIAGTCAPEDIGVIIYPDTTGTMIWGELGSIDKRYLNPCDISPKAAAELHDIFPFWTQRITREWVRKNYNYPLCQKIDERAVISFNFKTVSMSHIIPDLDSILNRGTLAIIGDIDRRLSELSGGDEEEIASLQAMKICMEALNTYALRLADVAERQAGVCSGKKRKEELMKLSEICRKVPAHPAETMDEAVNSMWIFWVGLVMENNNVSLSPGRLDQLYQPFFEADMAKLKTEEERKAYIEHVIELICTYFIRNAEHQNLVPDVANYLFSGSHAETAVTLGGVKRDGSDAVNDMTYIFLKVTEMMSMRDPNMNARYKPGVNSDTYLRRLCEVNYITVGTPSMHGDDAIFKALDENHIVEDKEDQRDWAATGCVEITVSGKHGNHAGATSINIVAGIEMALNNGYHPLMDWDVGPKTGSVERGDFKTFEDFYKAFAEQIRFIIDENVSMNNMASEAYSVLRPTPYLSAAIQGCVQKAKDVTKGGAIYNTSGTFNIGLADVVDSLMVIKKLVFEQKKISFSELKKAVDANFEGYETVRAMVMERVPKFGSGDAEALEMANRVAGLVHDCYKAHKNFRKGEYTVGFWSVAQHSAYGALSGAIPSGRLEGMPFTPGLTPQPSASKNFLDNIRDVARMDPKNMDNNIAFNVRLVPAADDSREKTIDTMFAYVKSYFDMGGMQIQFNIVSSDVLKDAMAHPENYKNLIVRISGYNAYFIHLTRDMQLEILHRAEFGI